MISLTKFYERRSSTTKMTFKPTSPQPTDLMAYRDENGQIKYAAAPAASQASQYDSDGEPLIPASSRHGVAPLDEEARQRFTATGRPIPAFGQSTLQSWGGDMYTVPQFLPKQYTDDSIIPAILTGVIPTPRTETQEGEGKRRKSFVKMFKGEKVVKDGEGKGITKVVFMPRRDYIKWFAKDNDGVYCGSEPFRRWTEQELDEKFGEFRPKTKKEEKGKSHNLVAAMAPSYRM